MTAAQLASDVAAWAGLATAIAAGVTAVIHALRSGEVHHATADDLTTLAHATPGVSPDQLTTPPLLDRAQPAASGPGTGGQATLG